MATDKQIEKYILVHSETCLHSIMQTMEFFNIEHQVYDWLKKYLEELHEKRVGEETPEIIRRVVNKKPKRGERRKPTRLKKKDDEMIGELPMPVTVVDICKYCEAAMVGEPIGSCERNKTGRSFYKMCTKCTYYVELFALGNNKFKLVEGGGI